VLIPADDYMLHQTSESLAYPQTTDLRFFERFIFAVHDRRGEICLETGLGAYPNMRSMDGFACVVTSGHDDQFNARFFRELDRDRSQTEVGPAPLQDHRADAQMAPPTGGESVWGRVRARDDRPVRPWQTHLSRKSGIATIFDMGHFVQACIYTGRIVVDGSSCDAGSSSVRGTVPGAFGHWPGSLPTSSTTTRVWRCPLSREA
jgi:hypothetical protein